LFSERSNASKGNELLRNGEYLVDDSKKVQKMNNKKNHASAMVNTKRS